MKYLFLSLIFLLSCQQEKEFIHPEIKQVIEAVYASGETYAENNYVVTSLSSGQIENIYFEQGDQVKEGDVLFDIKNNSIKADYESIKSALKLAELNNSDKSTVLNDLNIKKKKILINIINDSINYQRYKNLFDKQAISQSDFEKAEIKYNNSVNELNQLENTLINTQYRLDIEYKNALAAYNAVKERKNNYQIRSIQDGKIYQINKEKGEFISTGQALAEIGSSDKLIMKLKVDESDLGKIQIGQKILANIDVYEDRVFESNILKIYPKINLDDQTVYIEAELNEKDLHVGLTVEANIIINTKENALTIPNEYIINSDSVKVLDGKKSKMVGIKKGISNDEYTEVLSGLDINDKIVK